MQSLAKHRARGKVVAYRVNSTCSSYSDDREISAGNVLLLELPVNSSCTIRVDAGTERGFNNSVRPTSVVIPSLYDGQSVQFLCCSPPNPA